jgi:hypothetical protein
MHQSARHQDFLLLRKVGLSMVLELKFGKIHVPLQKRLLYFYAIFAIHVCPG